MKLGEMLVRDGRITEAHLAAALAAQARDGGRLGTVLVEHGFVDLEERLAAPERARNAVLASAVAALDMIDGSASTHASMHAAIGAYADAHREDAATVPRTMALAFGAGWVTYLAHVRVGADPALHDVAAQADVAWWR